MIYIMILILHIDIIDFLKFFLKIADYNIFKILIYQLTSNTYVDLVILVIRNLFIYQHLYRKIGCIFRSESIVRVIPEMEPFKYEKPRLVNLSADEWEFAEGECGGGNHYAQTNAYGCPSCGTTPPVPGTTDL